MCFSLSLNAPLTRVPVWCVERRVEGESGCLSFLLVSTFQLYASWILPWGGKCCERETQRKRIPTLRSLFHRKHKLVPFSTGHQGPNPAKVVKWWIADWTQDPENHYLGLELAISDKPAVRVEKDQKSPKDPLVGCQNQKLHFLGTCHDIGWTAPKVRDKPSVRFMTWDKFVIPFRLQAAWWSFHKYKL